MLTREQFVSAINDLQRAEDYQNGLNAYLRDNCTDGYIIQPDCSSTVVMLLEHIFGQEDMEMSDIFYFCYEIDFGRKFKIGDIVEDGVEIDLSSADKLYDYLISNHGGDDPE